MTRRLRREQIAVESVVVVDPGCATERPVRLEWPDESNEELAYPRLAAWVAPLVGSEDTDFAKSRRVLVEWDRPVEPGTVVALERWIMPWCALIEAGGYAQPVSDPEEVECIAGSVSQFDERSAEIAITRFISSEKAWHSLANMVERFSRGVGVLQSIVID